MKDLIIGAFENYNYEHIQYWINSIEKSGFYGDIILVIFPNVTEETIQKIQRHDITTCFFGPSNKNIPIHIERFMAINMVLEDLSKRQFKYRYVIVTDMKDVVFQSNPSIWLEKNLKNKLILSSECLNYKDEPWGYNNLLETFGSYGMYFQQIYGNKPIFNAGVIAGEFEYMKDFMLNLYLCSQPIVEQATMNVLIHTKPYSDYIQFENMETGWVCNMGTVIDPSKIEYFRPNLLEKEPVVEYNTKYDEIVVKTCHGEPFVVCHQYDRVPSLNGYFRNKYSDNTGDNT